MRSRRFRKAASPAVVAFAFALTTPLAADAEGGQETETVCVEMELSHALRVGAIHGVFQGTGASSGDRGVRGTPAVVCGSPDSKHRRDV